MPRLGCDVGRMAGHAVRGLGFSRYAYTHTQARPAPKHGLPLNYVEREAREQLPALVVGLAIDAEHGRPVILGHSDGATIALVYSAAFSQQTGAVVVLAPMCLSSRRRARPSLDTHQTFSGLISYVDALARQTHPGQGCIDRRT
jgi:pimeloyl-ACP methyl ester carboxylesterase